MAKKNQRLTDYELIEAFVACAIDREKADLGGTIREYMGRGEIDKYERARQEYEEHEGTWHTRAAA